MLNEMTIRTDRPLDELVTLEQPQTKLDDVFHQK